MLKNNLMKLAIILKFLRLLEQRLISNQTVRCRQKLNSRFKLKRETTLPGETLLGETIRQVKFS